MNEYFHANFAHRNLTFYLFLSYQFWFTKGLTKLWIKSANSTFNSSFMLILHIEIWHSITGSDLNWFGWLLIHKIIAHANFACRNFFTPEHISYIWKILLIVIMTTKITEGGGENLIRSNLENKNVVFVQYINTWPVNLV